MSKKGKYDARFENKRWDLLPRSTNANVIHSL